MKYRLKPEFVGLQITRRFGQGNSTITLDTTKNLTSEQLGNFWRFPAFKEFIEEYADTAPRAYQGIEHPVGTPAVDPQTGSDSETLCTLCGHGECQCTEPAKPTKPRRKNAKK